MERAAPVVRMLAKELPQGHLVVMIDDGFGAKDQFATGLTPAHAEIAVLRPVAPEALIETAEVQEGRSCATHVVGREKRCRAIGRAIIVVKVICEVLAGRGVRIARTAIHDDPAHDEIWLARMGHAQGRKPTGTGATIVIGEGEKHTTRFFYCTVARGGGARIFLPDNADAVPEARAHVKERHAGAVVNNDNLK